MIMLCYIRAQSAIVKRMCMHARVSLVSAMFNNNRRDLTGHLYKNEALKAPFHIRNIKKGSRT